MSYKNNRIKRLAAGAGALVLFFLLQLTLPCFPLNLTAVAEEGESTSSVEPASTDPEVTEPESTEAVTTEPEVTEAVTTEPETTEAVTTEAVTTEAVTTETPVVKTVTGFNVACGEGGRTSFLEGETFSAEGYEGTVTYSDGSEVKLSAAEMTFSPSGKLKASDTSVIFSCALTSRTSGLPITVSAAETLTAGGEYKSSYREEEENLDLTGMTLTVGYANGSSLSVPLSDCLTTPTSEAPLTGDVTSVTVSYTVSQGHTLTVSVPLTVRKAQSVEVRSLPDINFYEGRALACEPEDIGVYALFEGETEYVKVYNYDIPLAGEPLIPGEGGSATLRLVLGSAETDFSVAVCKVAENGYSVSGPAQDLYYGDSFDPAGIVVSATYEDGATFEITDDVVFTYPAVYTAGETVTASFMGNVIDISSIVKVHTGTLKIVKLPTKSEYDSGESFSPAGLLAMVEYDDGTSVSLSAADLTFEVNDPLTESDSFATASWNGLTAPVEIKVFPSRRIARIEISEAPDTVKYITGQSLSIAGIKVLVYYVGELGGEEVDPSTLVTVPELGSPVTAGMKSFIVRLKVSDSVYYDAVQPIEVESKTAIAINIITKPDRLEYTEGTSFNPAGMVVDLIYNDGTMIPITGYSIDVDDTFLLTTNDPVQEKTLRITYDKYETSLTVKVRAKAVKSISVLTPPAKTSYRAGESFDPSGMKIVLNYSDSSVSPVILPESYYTYAPTGKLTAADNAIYVSFRGQTAKVDITVTGSTTPAVTTAPESSSTGTDPLTPDSSQGSETATPPSESSDPFDTGSEPGPVDDTNSPDESGNEDVSSAVASSGDETTKSSKRSKTGGIDTIMFLWIGIIVLIVIALVLVIIYYKRHFT